MPSDKKEFSKILPKSKYKIQESNSNEAKHFFGEERVKFEKEFKRWEQFKKNFNGQK